MGALLASASAWALGLVPGLRTALIGAAATALIAGGLLAGIWLHSLTEGRRVAREAAARVAAENLKTEVIALKAATRQQAETLAQREQALSASEQYIRQLEEDLANVRNQGGAHDSAIAVPAGDPWLRAGPRR